MLSKGTKRKRSEDEALDPFVATIPSSSLFSLSVSKLHQSLQHVEPNLRHLVLVANTLRRLQGEMQPSAAPVLPPALGGGDLPADDFAGSAPVSIPMEPCRKPPTSLAPHVDELLLSNMDVSVFSTFLEDLNGMEGLGDSLQPSLAQPGSSLSPEPERTSPPGSPSSLEMLGSGGYLLEDGLEGLFEDIDTSMYDSDLWPPTSLPNLKEAFTTTGQEKLDLADLDYLMDMLVEAQEL
ncbi:SERTA domain-containing protein 1 [Sceloporus undulatus]|uniref:SERTA domain-containing protein 1 n=1 Tax=Sceloporus undulatus TaxID=8520 RepID=UPI001C4B456F|nr:SERTA domain-containing protein 1 [Sceloporus undulatus]XP_042296953.1 SERTA domain-containing protein 1 [Sceloporus undulatus]XP_042296954.1 SERTA domain-containing protein 1 [Sceloporus undulatus]